MQQSQHRSVQQAASCYNDAEVAREGGATGCKTGVAKSTVTSPPLPEQPGVKLDFRGGRGGAKLYDLPPSLAYPSPLLDQTGLFEQGRFDRQHVVTESVPVRIDTIERNNRSAVDRLVGGVDHFGMARRERDRVSKE